MYAQLFSLANLLAMISWLLLMALPSWKWSVRIVAGVIVLLFCLTYTFIIAGTITPNDLNSFGSLEGVMKLFDQPGAVLAGWLHYLAFDLMTGLYIIHNARQHNIPHIWLVPILFFTFMLGPVGLLLYWITRLLKTKKYFQETNTY